MSDQQRNRTLFECIRDRYERTALFSNWHLKYKKCSTFKLFILLLKYGSFVTSPYVVPERKLGFFVKIKKDEDFNHPGEKRIGTGIHTLSISRINPPKFGGGLKFESDADIGEKDSFRSGTMYEFVQCSC